jgi:hypothetical protein
MLLCSIPYGIYLLVLQAGSVPSPASPQLPSALIMLSRSLLALATASQARAEGLISTLSNTSSSLASELQQAMEELRSVALCKAKTQLREVGQVLLEDSGAWPGVEAAHVLGAVAAALQQAVALEALAAVLVLQEKQVGQGLGL